MEPAFDFLVLQLLQPRVDAAEKSYDLVALRALENELHDTIASLVQVIYQVQESIVGIANTTGMEKTWEEKDYEGIEEDIIFGRALETEEVGNLAEVARNATKSWLEAHDAPSPIRKLLDDLAPLFHGSMTAMQRGELNRMDAYWLASAYRDAIIQLHSLRIDAEARERRTTQKH